MPSLITGRLRQLLERDAAGQITDEDVDQFLKDPGRWRNKESLTHPAAPLVLTPRFLPFTQVVLDRGMLQQWMQKVYQDLNINCTVPLPPDLTAATLNALGVFGFRLFWIPELAEDAYPVAFKKMAWTKYLKANSIQRIPLKGCWVAVETIANPHYNDPAGYPNDLLGRALRLRTRFGVSWDTLKAEGGVLSKVATLLGLAAPSVRLLTVEEWNFLANLLNWLAKERKEALPNLGTTDSWEWCENHYGFEGRLVVADRESGGVVAVNSNWCGGEFVRSGFRVLAVLEPLAP